MPSLDDLKKRIKSVKSTQKITKAMKMVAAAKLKKAQENAEKGRPYSEKLQTIILNLTKSISDDSNAPKLLAGNGKDKVYLCVVITADRGLCGGFNSNICKLAKATLEILKEGKEIKIITVGSKGHDQIKTEYSEFIIDKKVLKKKQISFKEANEIEEKLLNYMNKSNLINVLYFIITLKRYYTNSPSRTNNSNFIKDDNNNERNVLSYEFEPDEDEILEDLLPKNVSVQIFKAFENAASEQGSG